MEDLKVVIGSDHAGYEYKEKIIDYSLNLLSEKEGL